MGKTAQRYLVSTSVETSGSLGAATSRYVLPKSTQMISKFKQQTKQVVKRAPEEHIFSMGRRAQQCFVGISVENSNIQEAASSRSISSNSAQIISKFEK